MSVRNKPRLGKGLSALLSKPVSIDKTSVVETTIPAALHGPDEQTSIGSRPHERAADTRALSGAGDHSRAVGAFKIGERESHGLGQSKSADDGPLVWLSLGAIVPSRFQPRQKINAQHLEALAGSIRQSGVMQPIAVRALSAAEQGERGGEYELVAGERRWRAAALAGLDRVPALVVSLNDRESAEWALVENMQREDLNAMDRAWGLRNLLERFTLTQEEAASRLGLERASVANLVRLTELEESIQRLIREGSLSFGHGRALLALPPGPDRIEAAKRAASESWSVRQTERWASSATRAGRARRDDGATPREARTSAVLAELERQLSEHLGTKVRIEANQDRTRGRVILEFFSVEHFDGLIEKMGFVMKS